MHIPYKALQFLLLLIISTTIICNGQDYDEAGDKKPAAPPPEQMECNGIYLSYTLISRTKELPYVKNVSAQAWAFKSDATILNAGTSELKAWKMFIGFQHQEILVSATGAVVTDGTDFPTPVGNGTTLAGYPIADLKNSIETAGDYNQIGVKVEIVGTQFGLKEEGTPMPKTIRLVNDGFKCPAPHLHGKNFMYVCCQKDPKFKVAEVKKTKFLPRQWGDVALTYDVLQAYGNNYLAQVTIENINPLSRLDHWNLTWEWMRGEFISTMRGAYTLKKDSSECIYGSAGVYYKDFDFSQVMNCEKRPAILDLPADRANDTKVGKLPYCCRNGSLMSPLMDSSKSSSIFQLQVYKMPPDMNRTALTPPQKWKINGILSSNYVCGPPIRVEPSLFPDPSGLQTATTAVASWQVVCNMTRPKPKETRCCVSFSGYYNESVIPCNTCACGCDNIDTKKCDPDARAMLLPAEAALIPFDNRTEKAKAWAKMRRNQVPKKLPCTDNCGVSINWHINSDFTGGWSARLTLFNWEDHPFEDWYTAIELRKAGPGYENVYSFNGTKVPKFKNMIMFQGLKDMNYLVAEMNGGNPEKDPRIPGKQQSVISFTKKGLNLNIKGRDGFPSKVFFNGEECALPTEFPKPDSENRIGIRSGVVLAVTIVTFVILMDWLS